MTKTQEASGFSAGLDTLATAGLNCAAFVPANMLASPPTIEVGPGSGLLLFLNLGPGFGAQTPYQHGVDAHPFDTRSRALLQEFLRIWQPSAASPAKVMYPGQTKLDLRRLLELARVQHRSLLGIGIRPDCGPWLAVRGALWCSLTGAERDLLQTRYPPLDPASHPCLHCADRPCVAACPAAAISHRKPDTAMPTKDLQSCLDYRSAVSSPCAHRCFARERCPVGSDARYPPQQVRYHYSVSLSALHHYRTRRPPTAL